MEALGRFAEGNGDALPMALLARDGALVEAVQRRLTHHGLLDPPADGVLGSVTQWALDAFCAAAGLPFDGELSRDAARALCGAVPVLPLRPGGDLAGRVAAALERRGDWIARHPDCVTIVYVEGMDGQGHRIARRPDGFDDLRLLLRVEADGRPALAGVWAATAAPGKPAVEEPAEPEGAPRLVPGQHRAWVIGRTAIGTDLEQDALVQVAPLRVTRDRDRDYRRDGDPEERGFFLMDQHGALDAPKGHVGGLGAGCLVGRDQAGHRQFMALLRQDPRWLAQSSHLFGTSLLHSAGIPD